METVKKSLAYERMFFFQQRSHSFRKTCDTARLMCTSNVTDLAFVALIFVEQKEVYVKNQRVFDFNAEVLVLSSVTV